GKDPYSRRPQPPDVAARQPEAADVVIQQKDFDAGMRALDQRIGESLPHFVVADDVELDVDVAFGARDAVEDRAEGRVSVDEEVCGVAVKEGQFGDLGQDWPVVAGVQVHDTQPLGTAY